MLNQLNKTKSETGVSPEEFRRSMSKFATGVAVITTADSGILYGMTVNSLTSLSLTPCLLLICPKLGSATGHAIRNSRRFIVNVLEAGQQELCQRFVGKDAKRFDGMELQFSADGLPLLQGCIAHISCRLHAVHPGGDHEIIVGEVIDCAGHHGDPMIFHEGRLLNGVA
ncbi:flavin reductase family protein [Roseicitreum antarcticum]|uniref:NADH-FMN oxidoreductase RutF, flavin reductase (DIM6/NTAB) family n=1 Tax=Roseicitreum antarcticum TaxID=564137 RepID=A0A1H2THP9_9RHOB|nr:flavin reductase family protein [Roseicitreum antarcticum]SDW42804.1 NADH-FMN oxidoreductase RutF, flavin reductase (DIM6/NTAB) family [Roseicitreum antarcticum]